MRILRDYETLTTGMLAYQSIQNGSSTKLRRTDLPQPIPGLDEILVRVDAVAVTTGELQWYPTIHRKDGTTRQHAVPGHEFSGSVSATGSQISEVAPGQEIYGMNDWYAEGALAEYCVTSASFLASKPQSLTSAQAASVPISALTAFEGLLDRAKLQRGETVLIHGAAGAVGLFAVQVAHFQGARVIATASAADAEFVRQIGADVVIDYQSERFEHKVGKVDVVFDTVGGEVLELSWPLLKSEERMISVASGESSDSDERLRRAFFIVKPNSERLKDIAQMLDRGTLKAFVGAQITFSEAANVFEVKRERPGKTVVEMDRVPLQA